MHWSRHEKLVLLNRMTWIPMHRSLLTDSLCPHVVGRIDYYVLAQSGTRYSIFEGVNHFDIAPSNTASSGSPYHQLVWAEEQIISNLMYAKHSIVFKRFDVVWRASRYLSTLLDATPALYCRACVEAIWVSTDVS